MRVNIGDNVGGGIYEDKFVVGASVGASWYPYFSVGSSGNIGIGTTNPSTKLHISTNTNISGTDSTTGAFIIGPSSGLNIGMDDNEIQARNASAASDLHLNWKGGDVHLGTNGVMNVISSSGNVGIGTTIPGYPLTNVSASATDQASVGANSRAFVWEANTGAAGYAAVLANAWTSGASRNGLLVKTADYGSDDFILTVNSNGTDRFVVRGDGNVGVETTGP